MLAQMLRTSSEDDNESWVGDLGNSGLSNTGLLGLSKSCLLEKILVVLEVAPELETPLVVIAIPLLVAYSLVFDNKVSNTLLVSLVGANDL